MSSSLLPEDVSRAYKLTQRGLEQLSVDDSIQQNWKAGYESRTDVPPDQRIEKTVFIKAPENFKYGDVVKVIDAVKGAGADPVGLQTEALEQ